MNTYCAIKRIFSFLLVCLLISTNIIAVEVSINGLRYDLKGTRATVLCIEKKNTQASIVVPETVDYNGYTYVVDSLADFCFSNIRVQNIGIEGDWNYDWALNGYKANGSDNYDDDFPSLLEVAFTKAFPKKFTTFNENRYTNNSYVTSITLGGSIRSIGIASFLNTNLTSVNMKDGITEIPFAAFALSKISQIEFPNSITKINSHAFCYSQLSSIVLSENISEISDYVFAETPIVEMLFPKSLKTLGRNLFYNCDLLRKITYLGKKPSNWYTASSTIVPDNTWGDKDNIYPMITWDSSESLYTGKVPLLTWTNNMEGYTVSIAFPQLHTDIGTWRDEVPVTFTKDDEIINVLAVCLYTIKPAILTAKVTNTTREYGGENPQFNISYSGFVNGENENVITSVPIFSTTASKTSNVGEYPITISGGSAKNYEFVYEPGVLTVTKAPLSAKVNDATKVYGARNPTFTIDYDGLKNNETAPAWTTKPTFQTEATQSSGVGSYTVKAINGVPTNYELGEITAGSLNITPAPLTINANDAARQYYSDNPTFNYTCNGFVNGDNENVLSPKLLLSTTATRTSNVGNYEIKVGEVSSPNYSISYVNGILTVTPRTLVASVGNYERLYNEENPAFEVKYDGFVGNEDENVLSAKATASTPATKTSDVGTYPINVTGASADNYTIDYTSGTLTINKAEQTLSWDQDLTGLKVGDQVELKAIASSGLPITYLMESDGAAELYTAGSKSFLDCLSNGQFLIRAIQEGNKNYYSSPRASCNVKIIGNADGDPIVTILQADNGSVSTPVSKGIIKTFTIIALEGWKIHSVSYNNEDVSDQLDSDGHFTTPAINSDATLNVVYEKDGEDAIISTKASSVKIQATEFGIRVKDANVGEVVYVYTTDGVLYKSVKVQQSISDIPLKSDAVYIVKVADKTLKLRH